MPRSKPSDPTGEIAFQRLGRADLPLIARWLEQAHVRQWWGDPSNELALIEADLDAPQLQAFLIRLDDRPVGYLQCYDPPAWHDHGLGPMSAGARGLDMFIGEPTLIGRGLGSRALRQFVDALFASGVPCALVDPDPGNAAAIAAYAKAGFRAGGVRETAHGPILLMVRVPG